MILSGLDFDEFSVELQSLAIPRYKIAEIYKWLSFGYKFSEMTNIDKATRAVLKEKYLDIPLEILKEYVSKDGTKKYLFKLHDGLLLEGVLMSYSYGNTLCISSQVGCRMGCAFCASGKNGLERNLEASEMLAEVTAVNRANTKTKGERAITNVVLMGSGEPFDNYDNVLKFIYRVSEAGGLNISRRNISLSTCGLVPKIIEFAELNIGVTLTISLHAPFDDMRKTIMPIANKYSVSELVAAAKTYFEKTGRRVVFEYTLIKGVNDSDACAKELAKLLSHFPSHVNCIVYNDTQNDKFKAITRADGYKFVEKLTKLGQSASLRREMGADIEGACGQLKRRFLSDGDYEQ